MKTSVLVVLALTVCAAPPMLGCERRDEKIIIDEREAKEKLNKAGDAVEKGVDKVGAEAKKLGQITVDASIHVDSTETRARDH